MPPVISRRAAVAVAFLIVAACGRGGLSDCANGPCSNACDWPLVLCDNSPRCVDLTSDSLNCGACGKACPGGQQCRDRSCACPSSTPDACGVGVDGGYCVDFATDASNCGACGSICVPGQQCVQGKCQCPASNPDLCTDGADAFCTNTTTDQNNCQSCGNVCSPGKKCSSTGCVETCAPDYTACPTMDPTYCANLKTDANNCSACGTACPAAQRCVNSVCACPVDHPATCDSGGNVACVDLSNDSANCGVCGKNCGYDPCVGGQCSHWAFVSSALYTGSMGGLTGADVNCQTLAEAASLHGQFKAWLSTGYASPSTRFTRAATPYVLVDRTIVAHDWQELTSGTLAHPIDLTEQRTAPIGVSPSFSCSSLSGGAVWTGTNDQGMPGYSAWGADSCSSWTNYNDEGGVWGDWGSPQGWSFSCGAWINGTGPPWICGFQFPIYCFEQ